MFSKDMRVESGTCKVCSAPCSSCIHYGLSLSAIGSTSQSGISSSICDDLQRRKTKSSFFNVDGMPISKCKNCDDSQNTETSKLSTSSSHNSYSEIAERKTNLRVTVAYEVLSSMEVFEQGSCVRKPDQDCTPSYASLSPDLRQRFHSELDEEQSESECHGDNILLTCKASGAKVAANDGIVDIKEEDIACSDVAVSSFVKVNGPVVPGYGFLECETGENHWNSSRSNASVSASSLDSNSYSASGCTGAYKPQHVLCKNDVSSKICSLQSNSQVETLPFIKYGFKDMKGTMNLHPKSEISMCSEADAVESSLASLTTRSSSEHRSSSFTSHETQTGILVSSCNSNIDDCKESKKDTDLDKQFDNGTKGSNADLEKDDAILNAITSQGDPLQPLVIADGEQSESNAVLYDVKVCDICGDAGREDLLATCSRCNDGAEHIYCMREKMNKVPGGDWLCEECKIKEIENQDGGKLKATIFSGITYNSVSTFIPRKRPKLEAGTTDLDAQGQSKGSQSPKNLTSKQVKNLQEGKCLEVGHSTEIASPMKRPVLSGQVSLKSQDSGKLKTANAAPSFEVLSAKGSEAISLSKTYLRSNSFKNEPSLYPPFGNISRSVSLSKVNFKPKIQKNVENDPHKQKSTRDLTSNDLRKQRSFKSLTKFNSFNSNSFGCLNANSGSKRPFHSFHIREINSPKEVQKSNIVEKKILSAVDNSFFVSSPAIATNNLSNVDSKSPPSDCKMNNLSEAGFHCSSKGSDDTSVLGADEGKKHILYSSKIARLSNGYSRLDNVQNSKVLEEKTGASIITGDGSCHNANMESLGTVVLPIKFAQNRISGSAIVVSPRPSVLDDNRTIHCKQCNETGHSTQHCSIDKFQGSSHKLATEWNSREVLTKRNRWIEAVDAATWRNRASKNNKTDLIEELPSATVDLIPDVASNYTPPGSCQTNVPVAVEKHKDKDKSKDLDVHPIKPLADTSMDQQLLIPFEVSLVPKPVLFNHSATVAETTQAEASLLVKSSSAFAVPMLECIWQGSFNVRETRNLHEMFDGFQAHISTCAFNKVFEVATKLPSNIQLDEVSHTSLWRAQCQVIFPQGENIALFFFAKDIESYQRSFRKLIEIMHRNDTALRGNIDGTELLVFSSNKLPQNSQRWNRMHYLWGMFKGKRRYSIPVMGEQKPSLPNLNIKVISQDMSTAYMKRVPCNMKNLESSSKLNRLPEQPAASVVPGESTYIVDNLHCKASNIEDTTCRTVGPSLVWNFSNQDAENPKVSVERLSSPVGNSSTTTAIPLAVEISKSRLQTSMPKNHSKEENIGTFQKIIITDCAFKERGVSLALPYYMNAEGTPRVSSVPQLCNQGAESSEVNEKMEENKCSSSTVAIMDSNPKVSVPQADYLSCESSESRKRGRSCSVERASHPRGELSNNTEEMAVLSYTHVPVEMEKRKKTCYTSGSAWFDSNVHPLHSSICSQQEQVESSCCDPLFPRNMTTAEMCFFPKDIGLVKNNKSSSGIVIPSSKDEDIPESCTPDLELALGRKSRSINPAAMPLPHIEPGSFGDDGGDVSATLSLSLSVFPCIRGGEIS